MFPSLPYFHKCTLVHTVAPSRNLGVLWESSLFLLKHHLPTLACHCWSLSLHQILLSVPVKYISGPATCLHSPAPNVLQATIPSPKRSHSWTLSKKANTSLVCHLGTLTLLFGVTLRSMGIRSCPG